MCRVGYYKTDFKQLCRLEGHSARKKQPSLIVSTLGGKADKKGENYRNHTHKSRNKPIFLHSFIIYARNKHRSRKTDNHSDKLCGELTQTARIVGSRHNCNTAKARGKKDKA